MNFCRTAIGHTRLDENSNDVRTTIVFTKEKLLILECNFVDQQNFGS